MDSAALLARAPELRDTAPWFAAQLAAAARVAGSAVDVVDVAVIGAGPAGLGAALQLVRAGLTVRVLDSNRPRHAATLQSHGFLSRDGLPPAELRRAAREEFLGYAPLAQFAQLRVTELRCLRAPVSAVGNFVGSDAAAGGAAVGFAAPADAASVPTASQARAAAPVAPTAAASTSQVPAAGDAAVDAKQASVSAPVLFSVGGVPARVRGDVPAQEFVFARRVIVATGLREVFPELPSLRVFYGTALHSCVLCDAFEKLPQPGTPLVLLGAEPQLFEYAVRLRGMGASLTVFTCGSGVLTAAQVAQLRAVGVTVREELVRDLVGERAELAGVELVTGEVVPARAGFVVPRYVGQLEFLAGVDAALRFTSWGTLQTGPDGQTGCRGLYAAGEAGVSGPGQLLTAAGSGALVAAAVQLDLAAASLGLPL